MAALELLRTNERASFSRNISRMSNLPLCTSESPEHHPPVDSVCAWGVTQLLLNVKQTQSTVSCSREGWEGLVQWEAGGRHGGAAERHPGRLPRWVDRRSQPQSWTPPPSPAHVPALWATEELRTPHEETHEAGALPTTARPGRASGVLPAQEPAYPLSRVRSREKAGARVLACSAFLPMSICPQAIHRMSFRRAGHYYWLLNGRRPPTTNPRRISEGWGIPSPIDSVFSRCNCDGKTFFIKVGSSPDGERMWREQEAAGEGCPFLNSSSTGERLALLVL